MSLLRKIQFVLFFMLSVFNHSIYGMEELPFKLDPEENQPKTQPKCTVVHNAIEGDQKRDLRIQLQFFGEDLVVAKTNLTTLTPGEKITYDFSQLEVWNDQTKIKIPPSSELAPTQLSIIVSWPAAGNKFHNPPTQPYGNGIRQTKKKLAEFVGPVNDNYELRMIHVDPDNGSFIRVLGIQNQAVQFEQLEAEPVKE